MTAISSNARANKADHLIMSDPLRFRQDYYSIAVTDPAYDKNVPRLADTLGANDPGAGKSDLPRYRMGAGVLPLILFR